MRKVITKLVAPNQVSFIPGRNITDNIIISQEIIHSMRNTCGKDQWMAIKVDIEKAYDYLRWDFIQDTLEDAGFPGNIIKIIMHCVSTSTMQLLWNGSMTESFVPSRGIRQGDPISPYLFVLCMERLGQLITSKCEDRSWEPFQVPNKGPRISHLFFADDLVLFCRATKEQAVLVNEVLQVFMEHSGLKANKSKTKIFFSSNTPATMASNITRILDIQRVEDLGKYLGVPLLHKRVTKSTYQFIVDKITQKLDGWPAKQLSLAGRITLAKSVLLATPTYFMQTTALPIGVCKQIEKIVRRFIWGGNKDKQKMALVRWETCCQPVNHGGLGLRSLKAQNQSLLLKLGVHLITNSEALWVKVMRSKYKLKEQIPESLKKGRTSHLMSNLAPIWEVVKQNTF